MINHRGQVVHADLVPTEVPELGLIRVEGGVVPRVAVAPRVPQPNIVVVVGQQVGCKVGFGRNHLAINHGRCGCTYPGSRWDPLPQIPPSCPRVRAGGGRAGRPACGCGAW